MLGFTYHLYLLTDYVTKLEIRGYVGSSLKIIMIVNLTLNIGLILI